MASITMAASFLGTSSSALTNQSLVAIHPRMVVVANATRAEKVNVSCDNNEKEDNNNGRRNIMFAAAAAVCSVAGMAVADEPKPGSPEAKKVYAPICVTMPTARVCRKGAPNRDD